MGLVRAVVICAVLGLTSGKPHGVESSAVVSLVKAEGETVVFNISRDPAPYTYLSWEFVLISEPVITVINGVNSTNDRYEDRITLLADGSLELRKLETFDRGDYTVNITSAEAPEFNAMFSLNVQQPVTNVSLSTMTTDVIEGRTVTLTCRASGSDRLYSFYNQSLSLIEGTIINQHDVILDRYDTGPFRCEAYNDVSRVSSEGIYFTFSYGPKLSLMVVPLEDEYAEGSTVTLTCTVESKPEAEITWRFKGDELPFNGTELVLKDIKYEQRGEYQCVAYNRKADQYDFESKFIWVKYTSPENNLSVGAQFGIAIACVAVVGGAAAGLAYMYHRKQQRARAF